LQNQTKWPQTKQNDGADEINGIPKISKTIYYNASFTSAFYVHHDRQTFLDDPNFVCSGMEEIIVMEGFEIGDIIVCKMEDAYRIIKVEKHTTFTIYQAILVQ